MFNINHRKIITDERLENMIYSILYIILLHWIDKVPPYTILGIFRERNVKPLNRKSLILNLHYILQKKSYTFKETLIYSPYVHRLHIHTYPIRVVLCSGKMYTCRQMCFNKGKRDNNNKV